MFSCDCLNVKGDIVGGSENICNNPQIIALSSSSQDYCEFFKSAISLPISQTSITIQHDALMQNNLVGKWNVLKCLNCDSYVYAFDKAEESILLNAALIRDKAEIEELLNRGNFSIPFKIVVKQIGNSIFPLQANINDDSRIKSLFLKLQEFFAQDEHETEQEIRRLNERLNQRRIGAEQDFHKIVALIQSASEITEGTNDNLTPPITPETIDKTMMLEDHLPQMTVIGKKAKNHKRVTKVIEFDDIFEIDGMQDDARNDVDHNHKYSDTDESDAEKEKVNKRRTRSGSINIARSAPLAMPNHFHAIDIDDDKPSNAEQMQHDIASSIKMLAKSIQVDSVFGELPSNKIRMLNKDFF